MSGEFKNQKAQELKPKLHEKKNAWKSGKCWKKVIRVKLGNGYSKVI